MIARRFLALLVVLLGLFPQHGLSALEDREWILLVDQVRCSHGESYIQARRTLVGWPGADEALPRLADQRPDDWLLFLAAFYASHEDAFLIQDTIDDQALRQSNEQLADGTWTEADWLKLVAAGIPDRVSPYVWLLPEGVLPQLNWRLGIAHVFEQAFRVPGGRGSVQEAEALYYLGKILRNDGLYGIDVFKAVLKNGWVEKQPAPAQIIDWAREADGSVLALEAADVRILQDARVQSWLQRALVDEMAPWSRYVLAASYLRPESATILEELARHDAPVGAFAAVQRLVVLSGNAQPAPRNFLGRVALPLPVEEWVPAQLGSIREEVNAEGRKIKMHKRERRAVTTREVSVYGRRSPVLRMDVSWFLAWLSRASPKQLGSLHPLLDKPNEYEVRSRVQIEKLVKWAVPWPAYDPPADYDMQVADDQRDFFDWMTGASACNAWVQERAWRLDELGITKLAELRLADPLKRRWQALLLRQLEQRPLHGDSVPWQTWMLEHSDPEELPLERTPHPNDSLLILPGQEPPALPDEIPAPVVPPVAAP